MEDKLADIVIVVAIVAIIAAKLLGYITWPWIWITAIIWIPLAIGFILAFGIFLFLGITMIIDKIKENKK